MSMKPGGPAGKAGAAPQEKPKNLWITVKRLMGYMKHSGPLIVLTLLLAVAGTIMQVSSPKLLGNATTTVFQGINSAAGVDFAKLAAILVTVALLCLGVFAASFLQERIMVVVAQRTTYALRNDLKEKMNRVPVSYFDKHTNGDLMSVATNDIDNIVNTMQQSLTQLISSAILVIGILWIMLAISPALTLLAFLMLPGSFLVMKLLTPRTQSNHKNYFKGMGQLNSQIEETYQGFDVIKSFNGAEHSTQKFRQINEQMGEYGWKARFFGGSMMPCMMLVQNLVYILIAIAGAVRVVGGGILIGDMQAFLQYSTQFSQPLSQFSQIWGNFLSTVASAERVFEVLDAEEERICQEEFPQKRQEKAKIVFDKVQFGYTEKILMQNFSLKVDEGQMIAIVGYTGAGKSTLINLLERFYEIQAGSIRLDGEDIRSVSAGTLRKRIGMVLQDTWLFQGSIYDNIRYGNDTATQEQVYAAAKAAFADDFIQKLPYGYDTVLHEDAGNISQGQRQLLTIARAFVSDPEILILDEATSNVDSRTEMIIQRAMKRLLKGRTSFVVAHRLSTIYDADRIVVMENGDIVETGTHGELLTEAGVYADIYNSQFAQKSA